MGNTMAKLPTWYRAIAVIVGLITVALAVVVLAFPALGLLTLVFILGFALMVIGIDRVVAGVTGHPFGWMPGFPGAGAGSPSPPSDKLSPPR